MIEDRAEKQILNTDQKLKSISDLFSKYFLVLEARHELNKIKETEQEINRDDLIYRTDIKNKDKTYDFQKFKTIRSFGREIYSGIITLHDVLEEQINLKDEIDNFK